MKYLERPLGRRLVPKENSLQTNQAEKTNDKLQGELEGLASLVAEGHPRQHNIVDLMGTMIREQVSSRESKDKEREPRYQDNITVFLKTEEGHFVGAKLEKTKFKVVFRYNEFPKKRVLEALHKTFPECELHLQPPLFFPADWIEKMRQRGFMGIRRPIEETPLQNTRALWLTVDKHSRYSESFDTLSEAGEIEHYYFSHDSLVVQAEPEVEHDWHPPADSSKTAWYLNYYRMKELPELEEFQQKFGVFLKNLLGEDPVVAISVHPCGWDVPITLREASQYSGFHDVKKEKSIRFDGSGAKESLEKVSRHHNEEEKFVFETGVNECGILYKRAAGYVIPYLFTRVKLFPTGGLPLDQLNAEIERMRKI